MADHVDRFHAALIVLAGHGHVKQRLIEAFERHLADIDEDDLPITVKQSFADLRSEMQRVAPSHGEGPICASVRKMSLDEAYGRVKDGEVWLIGCDIPEYEKANQLNHQPKRPRKLLLHRREIGRFAGLGYEKGLTLVPLKAYFKNGRVKVLLGIGRGRKVHDKRQKLKEQTARRDIEQALRGRRSG